MEHEPDAPDIAWVLLEAAATIHEESLGRILAAVRRTQSIPMRDVAPEIPKAAASLQQADAALFEEMWQLEITNRLRVCHSTLEFLSSWSRTIRTMTAGEVREVMSLRTSGADPASRIQSCRRRVELLLLSRPSGREYWEFARTLMEDIEAEWRTASGAARAQLLRYSCTVRSVVPSWVFEDDSPGASSKYDYRPVNLKTITSGGLPGQGKRV